MFFLLYSAFITLYIHHLNHLPEHIFNSLAPLSFHCTWAPECSERKITKYKTLQIVATINPWSASSIGASVMPTNHISFPSLALSSSVVIVSTIHHFSKNSPYYRFPYSQQIISRAGYSKKKSLPLDEMRTQICQFSTTNITNWHSQISNISSLLKWKSFSPCALVF